MIEVNNDNFDKEVLDEKLVLALFSANWCGSCRTLKHVLKELETSFKIVSIDVDEEIDLADEYKIRSIPCLIVFKDGVEVKRSVGTKTKKDIIDMMNSI